jgi:hypothetical protein
MIFSVTEILGYLRCNRQYDLTSFNRKALGPIAGPLALQTGTIWHQSMEELVKDESVSLTEIIADKAAKEMTRVRETYRERIGVYPDPVELVNITEALEILVYMGRNYQHHWGSAIPKGFELIKAEQTIVVDIPGTENQLELTLDALAQQTHTKRLHLIERKTYGSRPRLQELQKNMQFLMYLWGLKQAGLGEVGGILYDGAWKRAEPPRGSKMEDLFLRTTLTRSPFEIDNVAGFLALTTTRMAAEPDLGDLLHPIYNIPFMGCFDCTMEPVCTAYNRGEDYNFVLNSRYAPRIKQGFAVE